MKKKSREKALDPKRLGVSRRAQNYFNEYINSIAFQRRVADIRKRFDIPANGLKSLDLREVRGQKVIYNPREWKHFGDIDSLNDFRLVLSGATETFDLGEDQYWHTIFRMYVFHNKVPPKVFSFKFSGGFNLSHADYCLIMNLQRQVWGSEDNEEPSMVEVYDGLRKLTESYPVAIFISKYSSQRRINEFVKDKWPLISLEQLISFPKSRRDGLVSHTRLKVGKYRPMKGRDAYILKLHKDGLPPKQIRVVVGEKYPPQVDSTYISTLINREEKRQQEV